MRVSTRPRAVQLRLTIGLAKRDGRWIVIHEHHSFTDTTPPAEPATEMVQP